MKRHLYERHLYAVLFTACAVLFATTAHAGAWDVVKTWSGGTAIALILTGVMAIGAVSYYTDTLSKILIALGGFFTTVGLAFADRKLTKEEIADMKAKLSELRTAIKEIKDAHKK